MNPQTAIQPHDKKTLKAIYKYVHHLKEWDKPYGTDTRAVVWIENGSLRYSWTRKGMGD